MKDIKVSVALIILFAYISSLALVWVTFTTIHERRLVKLLNNISSQVQLNNVAISGINANLNNLDINYDVIVKEKRD